MEGNAVDAQLDVGGLDEDLIHRFFGGTGCQDRQAYQEYQLFHTYLIVSVLEMISCVRSG